MSNNGNGKPEVEQTIHDMPEVDVRESEPAVETSRSAGSRGKPLYTKSGNRRLANQILSAPLSIEDAAAWTSLNLKNVEEVKKVHHILNALNHCYEFNIECGIEEIKRYLIFMPAAGGWGRALAAMIETGIIAPSALGVNLSRKDEKEFEKLSNKKSDQENNRKDD